MKILAIETSCDDTAISIVEFKGSTLRNLKGRTLVNILSHQVSSQVDVHKEFGGVVPSLAKREHGRNLIPILKQTLSESKLLSNSKLQETSYKQTQNSKYEILNTVLEREPELLEAFEKFIPTIKVPEIDAIAVTQGPGLEPALWVGLNFAKALATIWQKPLIPINHLEGHIFSATLVEESSKSEYRNPKQIQNLKYKIQNIDFPAIALLVSGGHTELVLVKKLGEYKSIGGTRDDAVGEAFDKVARLLGLPYPGGPEISRLASKFQPLGGPTAKFKFPRPMINSDDFDFSFSGIKTSVRYKIEALRQAQGFRDLPQQIAEEIAYEFEEAVIDVLLSKTLRAIDEFGAKTLIVGGGVIANKKLRAAFESAIAALASAELRGTNAEKRRSVQLLIPELSLTTDNATMIALAAHFKFKNKTSIITPDQITSTNLPATGTLKLSV